MGGNFDVRFQPVKKVSEQSTYVRNLGFDSIWYNKPAKDCAADGDEKAQAKGNAHYAQFCCL